MAKVLTIPGTTRIGKIDAVRRPDGMKAIGNGRPRTRGATKLEIAYGEHLKYLQDLGSIAGFYFEAVKLRLADKTWYTPDFMVMRNDGSIEFREVKGHWEDDARVKIKVVAELFPWFTFRAYQKRKGEWIEENF